MPSPFPGMDPYLETPRRWPDFHNHLAAEISAALNGVLGPGYVVSLTSSTRLYRVEVLTTDEEQLVTAIEILSPANKRLGHQDRADYLRKRRDLLLSSAH